MKSRTDPKAMRRFASQLIDSYIRPSKSEDASRGCARETGVDNYQPMASIQVSDQFRWLLEGNELRSEGSTLPQQLDEPPPSLIVTLPAAQAGDYRIQRFLRFFFHGSKYRNNQHSASRRQAETGGTSMPVLS